MRGKSKRELAELDYLAGMKYREIAEKYDVSIDTVKSWKVRHSWARERHKKSEEKCTQKVHTKKCTQKKSEKEERDEAKREAAKVLANVDKINERQRLFALYYFQTHNAASSYQRAYGCTRAAAVGSAYKLLKNPVVAAAIREMQDNRDATLLLKAGDVIELYMRIAFADYGDFVSIKDGKMMVKDIDEVDGQLISAAIQTKDGVIVRLADRIKALRWLASYFELNPSDRHRAAYQAKMAELREREIKSKEDGW